MVTVMAKYLQMMSVYSIHKEEPDRVTEHFQRFNKDFGQLCESFKEVTHQDYKPGHEVKMTKPLAPKPQRQQQQTLSNQEQVNQTSSRDPNRGMKRIGADGKVAFFSPDKSPREVPPGRMPFKDLSPFDHKSTIVKDVKWVVPEKGVPGQLIFPSSFSGEIATDLATSDTVRYYGAKLANKTDGEIDVNTPHRQQTFWYAGRGISGETRFLPH